MAVLLETDNDSDFGYDFSPADEQLLLSLASFHDDGSPPPLVPKQQVPFPTSQAARRPAVDAVPGQTESLDGNQTSNASGSAGVLATASRSRCRHAVDRTIAAAHGPDEDAQYPDLSRALSKLNADATADSVEAVHPAPCADDAVESPLQRFRSFPRRPLMVSDLTSGAWCELQYWYTLTRLPGGRRTRTAAMRHGSEVHQRLEDEVHRTVRVEVLTKEDAFGLRLWNLIQGLRTLRDRGLTRELEVWGMVDGSLVNGVIDQVSYQNPNPKFQEELSSQEAEQSARQSTLPDYFPPKRTTDVVQDSPKIYLTDVKTRGSMRPASAVLLRPAKIQLLLYHRFLADMAARRLDFLRVLERYGLDPDAPFSDAFMSNVGMLHDEIFVDAPASSCDPAAKSGGPLRDEESSGINGYSSAAPDLLKYRTLRELLTLVQREIELSFPRGAESLGHMLRVQYLHREDGRELDLHDFPVSNQALDGFLDKYMSWWRGEREARGVAVEEAFKCRTCEFAADCSWRQHMDVERLQRAQKKMSMGRGGSVPT